MRSWERIKEWIIINMKQNLQTIKNKWKLQQAKQQNVWFFYFVWYRFHFLSVWIFKSILHHIYVWNLSKIHYSHGRHRPTFIFCFCFFLYSLYYALIIIAFSNYILEYRRKSAQIFFIFAIRFSDFLAHWHEWKW